MILVRIILAALASLLLGFLWYHPRLFGKQWMALVNVTPEMVERGRRRAKYFMLVAFIGGAFIASASQMVMHATGTTTLIGALLFSFIVWLGFIVPTAFIETIWEERPLKLLLINSSYWLVVLIVVSLILVS